MDLCSIDIFQRIRIQKKIVPQKRYCRPQPLTLIQTNWIRYFHGLTNVAPNRNNPLRSLVSLTNDITNRNSTSEKNDGNDATGHNFPIASKRGRISKNADLKIINQKVNSTFMKRWRKKDLTDLLLEKEKERRQKDNSSKLKKAQLEKQRKKLIEIQID